MRHSVLYIASFTGARQSPPAGARAGGRGSEVSRLRSHEPVFTHESARRCGVDARSLLRGKQMSDQAISRLPLGGRERQA